MTAPGGTPGLPSGSVLTLDNMESRLQDMSPGAMKARAVDWFPPMANSTTGGNPASGATPFGVLTGIWSRFNATIAAADPSAVNSVEDLGDLFDEFVHNLPVVGKFVELIEAFTGDYEGDDAVLNAIQDLFGTIPKLINGLLSGAWIPQIDASKIISGILSIDLIPGLDVSKIISGIFSAIRIPGLDASKIVSGKISQTFLDILAIPGNIISSVIDALRIPSLDASKVTTGTLGTAQIPNLPTSKITSGTFAQTMVSGLGTALAALLPKTLFNGFNRTVNLASDPWVRQPGQWAESYLAVNSGWVEVTKTATYRRLNLVRTADGLPGTYLPTQAGRKYEFSCEAKLVSGTPVANNVTMLPRGQNEAGTLSSQGSSAVTVTSTPSVISMIVTTAAATVEWMPILEVNDNNADPTKIAFRNFKVIDITESNSIIGRLFGGDTILTNILGSVIPGLDGSKITSGSIGQAFLSITNIASSIVSGIFGAAQIPSLDASKISSGTLGSGQIPDLDAGKITTGQLPQARISLTSIAANLINGTLAALNIPTLDASKVSTGTFTTGQIPDLDAAKVTTGTFPQSRVTLTSIASSLLSGVIGSGLIPSLDASKIQTGTLLSGVIPALDAAKITTGKLIRSVLGVQDFENLAAGSDFEGTHPWNSSGWAVATDQFKSGTKSYKRIGGAAGSTGATLSGDFEVKEGDQIYVEYWARADAAYNPADAKLRIGDQANAHIGSISAMPGAGIVVDAWTKLSGTVAIGAGVTSLTITFPANHTAGNLWVDDIVIRRVKKASWIEGLPGSKIISSVLSSIIPVLDATKITSGSFDVARVPALPTSKITSGTFPQSMLTITSLAASIISGIFPASQIPTLDATKIGTGTLDTARVPDLAQSKITGLPGALSLLTGSIQGIKDRLTGYVNSTDTDLDNWLLSLLTGDSVPLSSLSMKTPNLLPNGRFASSSVLNQPKGGTWSLDAANRVGTYGNGLKVAGGGFNYITLPRIRVSDSQGLTSKVSVKWSGVTGASAFVAVYANPVGGETTGWQVMDYRPITGTQGSWIEFGGDYTVADENTEYVELVLSFADATAGTVWFSDASVIKPVAPGLIPPEVVRGLPDAFDAMGEFVQSLGSIIIKSLTGIPFIGWLFSDLEEEISDWFDDTQVTAARADDAWSDVQATISHIVGAVWGRPSNDPDEARTALDKMYTELLENAKAIDAMRSRDSGEKAGGQAVTIDFGDYPDGPLPSILSLSYTGPGTSQLHIKNGVAQWNNSNNANRDCLVRYNVGPTDTDFQVSRGTMAAPPEDTTDGGRPHFYALNRLNVAGNERVWARAWSVGSFFQYKVDIGCTIAGVDYVWLSGVDLTWSLSLSFVCGVGNNPRQYQVFSGSKVVASYIEADGEVATYANLPTGLGAGGAGKKYVNLADGRIYTWSGTAWSHPNNGTAPLASKRGPDNRWWGSLAQLRQDNSGVPNGGGKLSACAVADNELPSVLGTTVMMYRTSTSGVPFPGGGPNALQNNFFQFIGRESRDIDGDPATGVITILKRGSYYVRGRINIGTALTSNNMLHIQADSGAGYITVSSGAGIYQPQVDQGLEVADMLHLEPGNKLRLATWKSGTIVSSPLNGGAEGRAIFSATRIPDAMAA